MWTRFLLHTSQKQYWAPRESRTLVSPRAPTRTSPSSLHPSWLKKPSIAWDLSTHSTPKIMLTSHASTIPAPSSSTVTGSRALIEPHAPSLLKTDALCPSNESTTPLDQISNTRPDLSPATSLPSHRVPPPRAPTSPNLSPVQVKREETDPDLPRRTEAVAQPSAAPQAIPQPSLGPWLERPPKTEPSDTPPHSWAGSSSAVTTSPSVPILRNPAPGLPPLPPPPSPPRGRTSTRSSRSSPGGQSQQSPSPGGQSQQSPSSADSPPSPSSLVMSSPAPPSDKEMLKLHLPLRYDGKTVVECNRFISQLLIYWAINTTLSTVKLKVQVALSLLDGDARAWATPIFAQLAAVQIGTQGSMTPFTDEAAFLTAFKARFGNLDNTAAAQVELTKLCADKTVREKRTAAEFSALFKGPADRSGYGDLELRDKYLSGIPSRVYRKIELETFATWQAADKCATEVEQILDVSQARRPELNNFFSTRGRGRGGARGGAP
ncbi:predicted protein [Postia placenta Mad-698-R]|uniref:Retrotransposon gag domain-containing protein n=1 Tax=Postia placenta MAD-698-R-SB12 TaxID=670580 RepID=A0A1X6MK60_9APHY|nr:hypothetical protein POSPLADRAFT_1159067 [Postia placenta MAD-698-R-SB12]EED77886.1 predicted protein [Postia placenta Mad-698-R]OSX56817.1 hypothetical protein POSPLADRAFT_1159067 [Postia placenta MAD-698-R-SB12]